MVPERDASLIIGQIYDRLSGKEWDRLARHRTEFAVTLRVLNKYLTDKPANILDIGGGPGRYSIALHQLGHRMVLANVSKGNLELARQKAAERNIELSAIIQTDARALGLIAGSQFDAVLLMGPLYHLLQRQERELTLLEAGRRLKQGGFLFASAITRFAPIRHIAENDPEMIIREPEKFSEIVDLGISRAGGAGLKPDYYFSLPEELMRMISAAGFVKLEIVGCEGVISSVEEKVNGLAGDAWEAWVSLNYRLGREASLYGAADHLLIVGQKL